MYQGLSEHANPLILSEHANPAPLNLARTFVTQISQIRLGMFLLPPIAYNSILREILVKHAPEKPKTVIQWPIQKWFNDEPPSTKRQRRKAERKWRDSDNSIDLHQDYKSVKYEFESLIKSTKTEYYNATITQCGSDSKSVQKVVDELLYRGPEVTLPISNCDGDLTTHFSTFFRDKTEKICANMPHIEEEIQIENPPATSTLSSFKCVSTEEVKRIITSGPSKSCSLDPVPTWLLKKSLDDVLPAIIDIINASLTNGSVPDSMKCAIVSPLLKKPSLDKEILKTTGPSTLLPINLMTTCRSTIYMRYISQHIRNSFLPKLLF